MTNAGRQRVGRLLGYTLIGTGAAALVAAVLLPTYIVPRLKRIPADIRTEAVSLASNASVLDVPALTRGRMATETGVPLKIQTLAVSARPTDADRVTLVVSTRLLRTDRPSASGLVSAHVDSVTLSRTTSEPVDPPGQIALDYGKQPDTVTRTGFQYHFPFDAQKTNYPYFDDTARKEVPIGFVDDDRVESGLRLFHYRQSVGPIDLYPTQPDMETTVPASWWGLPGDEQVRFDLYYSTTRDIWVEPASGVIIEQREHLHRFLARSVDDPLAVTSLEIQTHFDGQSINDAVQTARAARTLIRWGDIYAPGILGVVGVVAALGGLMILRRRETRLPRIGDRHVAGVNNHDADGGEQLTVEDVAVEHDL